MEFTKHAIKGKELVKVVNISTSAFRQNEVVYTFKTINFKWIPPKHIGITDQ